MIRIAALAALLLAGCTVNEYCINCAVDGDGGTGDATDASDGSSDAIDAYICTVSSTVEICDNIDNDCDGNVDNDVPGDGDPCDNQMGECSGGVKHCTGGHMTCSKPPSAERCDGLDNNCNGEIDENDPEGGGACGTNAGECTAGVMHCNTTTHAVECIGAIGTVGGVAEECDGKDNDCDGMLDEGVTSTTACGGPNAGECHTGTFACMGGGFVCIGDAGPTFEICDDKDNDCDGAIDNGYDKSTDPRNCGSCNHVCTAAHAIAGCAAGGCTIASCDSGYHDVDPLVDGCEYGPCQADGTEVCDGVDNDCDGGNDNGLVAPAGLCKTLGACAGAAPVCQHADGWRCAYSSDVSTDVDGSIVAETACDGIDNDCDGKVDENQPNKGGACHDAGIGACQGTGTFVCNPADVDGPAICDITMPGQAAPEPEKCDGKDNNCDGIVDNTTGAARVIDSMSHITVGALDYYMDTYEASRPDATGTASGTGTSRACSNPNVVPWNNVSYDTAKAACESAGKTLCSATQWQTACEATPARTYPYGNTFGASTCNTESNDGIAGGADDDVLLATGAKTSCVAAQGPRDLSGNVKEWTSEKTGTTSGASPKDIFVLRGGAYDTPKLGATCQFRLSRAAQNVLEPANGFRCCKATAP